MRRKPRPLFHPDPPPAFPAGGIYRGNPCVIRCLLVREHTGRSRPFTRRFAEFGHVAAWLREQRADHRIVHRATDSPT